MMRRARWLAAGAVLGAVGYQRLQRAARSQASPSAGAARWLARQLRSRLAGDRRPARGGAGGFIGDVRAGMDEYLDRHQANIDRQYRRSGNTLITQRAPDRAAIRGGQGQAREPRPGA